MGIGLRNMLDQPLPVDYHTQGGRTARVVISRRGYVDMSPIGYDALSNHVRKVMIPRGWLRVLSAPDANQLLVQDDWVIDLDLGGDVVDADTMVRILDTP